jgi:hypothetical protein
MFWMTVNFSSCPCARSVCEPGMAVVAAPESASLMSAWPTLCAHLLDLQRQFGDPNRAFTSGSNLDTLFTRAHDILYGRLRRLALLILYAWGHLQVASAGAIASGCSINCRTCWASCKWPLVGQFSYLFHGCKSLLEQWFAGREWVLCDWHPVRGTVEGAHLGGCLQTLFLNWHSCSLVPLPHMHMVEHRNVVLQLHW